MKAASPRCRQVQGLTLVELLVGLALMAIVLTAVQAVTTSTMHANALLTARAEMQSDAVIANQLLLARAREACAVAAQGSSVTLPNVPGTQHGASRTWQVGTEPFVAFVTPDGAAERFYAYYLLSRADYEAQMPAQQSLATVQGAEARVMMEFTVPLAPGTCNPAPGTVAVPPTSPAGTGATALMVVNNVRVPTAAEPLFTVGADQAIVYTVRFERQVGARRVVLPAENADPYRYAIVGRNIR
ncbi:PilW family protein [Deinococcus hohokamensis]|uniref:PilW family protein n=1 Tax=Deinococcus hohokamensis TaxID=309883 RepID=A0ABV9I841_9DEIO